MSIHDVPKSLSKQGVEAAESITNIDDYEVPRVVGKKFEKGAAHETMDKLNSRKAFKTEVPDSLDIGTDVTISASANQVKDIGNRDNKEFLRALIEFDENGTKQPIYTKRNAIVPSDLQINDTEVLNVVGNEYTLNIQAPVDAIDYKWVIRMDQPINNVRLRVYRGADETGVLIYESHSDDDWEAGNGFNWEGISGGNPTGENEIFLNSELDIRGGDIEFVLVEWTGTQTFSIRGFDFGSPIGFIPYIQTFFFPEEDKIIIDEEYLEVVYVDDGFTTENIKTYGANISANINVSVSSDTKTFTVFDTNRSFRINRYVDVDFGGTTGVYRLNTRDDHVLFYKKDVDDWYFYNFRNQRGGQV